MAPYRGVSLDPDVGDLPALVTLDGKRLPDAVQTRFRDGLWDALAGRIDRVSRTMPLIVIFVAFVLWLGVLVGGGGYMTAGNAVLAMPASILYGLISGLVAHSIWRLVERRFTDLRGRVLAREGLIDISDTAIRFAPADRIARILPYGAGATVVLDDGQEIIVEKAGPTEAVLERGDEIRRARGLGDPAALRRLEWLSRDELAAARARPRRRRRSAATVAVITGSLAGILAYTLVQPAISIANASAHGRDIVNWKPVVDSHPLPWVKAWANRVRAERRERTLAHIHGDHRAAFREVLEWVDAEQGRTFGLLVVHYGAAAPATSPPHEEDLFGTAINRAMPYGMVRTRARCGHSTPAWLNIEITGRTGPGSIELTYRTTIYIPGRGKGPVTVGRPIVIEAQADQTGSEVATVAARLLVADVFTPHAG